MDNSRGMENSCEHARELMVGAWMRDLSEMSAAELHQHLAGCAECAAEMEALGAMWEKLGDLPAPEPSLALRVRWEQTLGSLSAPAPRQTYRPAPLRAWWQSIWPANPAWQMAIAGLCLMIGLGAGVYLQHDSVERDEVAKLREEVASTKEMVAISLLQQQSATERLRGVDYSTRMASMEPLVVTALIQAVNRDSNVNVRLAAIDALGKVANESQVRQSMQEALPQQDSPMVQAALIDYLVQAHDRNAVGAIRDLVARQDLNPTVRDRATYAVRQLAQ
jgi:HEAT repeats